MKEELSIKLTKNEALILFDFLSRFNQSENNEIFEDKAEQKIFWTIGALLEKQLTEPFLPNYKDIISEARKEILDEE
ncbi:hypothetical protein ACFX5F_00005 [Flavobacterium sp. ZS1P70]|uniref:Uncharacterized protein n=1 Tax=Flavobacterium zhoui TaxID=3230414 RepID=A0ABW6I000_9FLAO